MSLSKLAVSRPTTTLILFVILTALGIYSAAELPIDLLPDMEIPYIAVATTYENAGPEEVERSVTRPLESSLSSVTGLENMQSISSSGSSLIMMEFTYGTNLDAATNEIRDKIDLVRAYLPEDTESPLIVRADPSMMPIMSYVLSGNRTPEELRQYAEDVVQPRLEQVDGVASASIRGGREKAVIIDIPRDRLEAYSLTITQIAQMIGSQNVEGSGGNISEADTTYTITTSGEYSSLEDIRNTVVAYKAGGLAAGGSPVVSKILLRDIADIYEGYKTVSSYAYLNGVPCVILTIQKQSGKNSVQAAEQVREQVVEIQAVLPDDIKLTEEMNTTDIIETSINNILSSVISGAALAVLVLLVFLRSIKSTIIISLTIPIALVITLGVMKFTGFSLNLMTLAGLSLGVGMLVDNSIVILENIYSYRARGAKPKVAAILGSQEMLMAISASTLTTICVFLPLIMYGSELGMVGQIFSGLTFTVVFSLICSLAVAVILVPVLSSKYLKLENIAKRQLTGVAGRLDRAIGGFLDRVDNGYANCVRWVLHHKVLLLVSILVLLAVSIALIPVVGFINMPEQASNTITVNLDMPKGTRLESTDAVIRQLENLVMQNIKGLKSTTVSVGGASMMGLGGVTTNTATLDISLYAIAEREPGWDTTEEATAKVRSYFNQFPGASFSISNASNMGGMSSSDIDVVIKSNSMEQLQKASNDIVNALVEHDSDIITDITSSFEDGLPQIDIVIDRNKLQDLGLNIYSVSNEIKANVNGATASSYRASGDEIDIVVQLTEDDRSKILDLEQIFVTNSSGQRIPLASFASYQENTSPVSIVRENQMRTIHVTAKKLNWKQSAEEVQKMVERTIQENVVLGDDVRLTYSGGYQDLQKNLRLFAVIIIMAIILVFAVMASQFESLLDPFIVLFTIPLSVIGIVAIYLAVGSPLNIITAVGALVLVGVVVNNGIVLVDYTNLLRKREYDLEDACVEAARSRLRPILMTTLTTVLGLLPMAFFPGEGSEMTQPIGQTVLGGLSFSTTMTLFLMPVLYYIFNRYREKRNARRAVRKQRREEKKAIKVAEEARMRASSNKKEAKSKRETAAASDEADEEIEEFSAKKSYGMEDIDE